jgi:outer membrane protein assembly factor BamA
MISYLYLSSLKQKFLSTVLALILVGAINNAKAQLPGTAGALAATHSVDSIGRHKPMDDTAWLKSQRDLIDIFLLIVHKNIYKRFDTTGHKSHSVYISAAPAVQYALSTGVGVNITGNAAFFTTADKKENLSTLLTYPTYTQNKQLILPLQSSIWTRNNKYNFLGDWRYLHFPEQTFGLGGTTTDADAVNLDYNYLRFYQYVLRKVAKDFFIGPGYQLDYHYDIQQVGLKPGAATDFNKYGYSPQSWSSGVSLDFLYDTRRNSINPEGGSTYANLILRQNLTALGSDQNWTSLLIDVRKYFSLPGDSRNVLAFWSFDWLTLSGNPPYLDLPSNGWDTYDNTGRGYIQSRFRSKNMLDLEAEYRFGILNNGLIGGVVFANAESFSQMLGSNGFQAIAPGAGLGLRIKFNKFSKTNIAIDYGWGMNGSNGLFLNLGEVF